MAGKAKGWTGAAGLSLISLSGNASALTFSATAAAQRKFEVWAVSFKAFGTYGQARVTGLTDAQVVAMAAGGQLRGDRNLTEKVTLFALTGAETNHVKSIEWMAYGEVGTGITWIDVKEGELQKTLLRTDLGLRYSREYQFQYYPTQEPLPSREIIGPRVALAFRHALTKEIIFNQDAEILPNLAGESRFLLNTSTRLSSRLTESLSLGVAFVINHDSRPAPGKLPTDTALTVGVEMAL